MSNESPDLTTLDREALARMVSNLEAQLTASRIRTAEVEAAHTETLNEGDRLRARIDCGVSRRDGCLNPKQVCLMCQLASANCIARERTKEACGLTAQLAAARADVERLTGELTEAERMFTFAAKKGNRHLESLRKTDADSARLAEELKREVATSERVLMQNSSRWAQLVGKLAGENDGLRAALAQVGDLAKIVIADAEDTLTHPVSSKSERDYQRGRSEVAHRIAAIGAASAPDNAISQAPANSDTLAALTERILNLKSYLDNAPNIELDTSNVRALVDNLAAIVAVSAETIHAVRSNQTRPCCSECNEEKNLVYIQTNAEAEEWLCKTCQHHFQFKPPAEGREAGDGKQ